MSPFARNETNHSYPSHHDGDIGRRILFESRQREIDYLHQITGEILVNEYVVRAPSAESAA